MRMLFVVDPVAGLDPGHDSSVALIEAAQRRGHDSWTTTATALSLSDRGAFATARPIRVEPVTRHDGRWHAVDRWYAEGPPEQVRLDSFGLVWMRTDPPVDEDYLTATFVLDHAGTTVVNHPAGLRTANEKLSILHHPRLTPPTLVSADRAALAAFVAEHRLAVLKPVQGMAGRGIALLRPDDPNQATLLDAATRSGRRLAVVQAYLPACVDGDRRIIVAGNEPVGSVRRIASGGDFRCNMAAGARVAADQVTAADRALCAELAPLFDRLGLLFVGLDVIGGMVTEINVTSPTGLREMDLLGSQCVSDDVLDRAEGWAR